MLNFYATKRWSDNNHLTTKAYYDEMFANIDHLNGAMEWGMMAPAKATPHFWLNVRASSIVQRMLLSRIKIELGGQFTVSQRCPS